MTDNNEAMFNTITSTLKEFGGALDKVGKDMVYVKTKLKEIDKDTSKTRITVAGNGHPEDGLAYRFGLLEHQFKKHVSAHENKDKKIWDIVKPIIGQILSMLITGGVLFKMLGG